MPEDASLWVYPASRILDATDEAALLKSLAPFLEGWASHGRQINASAGVFASRFLLIAGYIPDGEVSGCGVDASVHAIEAAGKNLDIHWLTGLRVFFRDRDGLVRDAPRKEFRALAESGIVNSDTVVFDTSINSVHDLRLGRFECKLTSSWHESLLRPTIPAQ